MDNRCFIEELLVISLGRRLIPDFDYRLWVWVQTAGLDVSPTESTNQLIARLDDSKLISLSKHVLK
ncbi:MAG: hypothetical protein AAGI45_25070 [Cyanobacteria bacterium P01_H01_bin.26]